MKPKFTLLTAATSEYAPLARITDMTKEIYARKHGYEFRTEVMHETSRIAWQRVDLWLKHLRSLELGDWLWFTGTDVMITNYEVKLDKFIGKNVDLVFAADVNGLQCDSLLMRNCLANWKLLKDVQTFEGHVSNEQDALVAVLSGYLRPVAYEMGLSYEAERKPYRSIKKALSYSDVRIKIIQNKYFNCCPPGHYRRDEPASQVWRPGYFLLHMHSKSLQYRLEHMPAYLTPCKP